MKLQSVNFVKNNSEWYSKEYLPNSKRDILLYSLELGTSEGYYDSSVELFWVYKWKQYIMPEYWRELPRYDGSNNSL